ncbi:MAG: hypothetical protein P1V97_20820, partial [Planctomycetota bacterium]|nr:hypothetical protein [Planctomycetota bacterium]
AAAIYDVALLIPLAIPGLVDFATAQLHGLHRTLELTGHFPEFAPLHFLFMNVMASISVVWGVMRIRDPRREYGFYDCVMRGSIALTILYYVLFSGVSSLMWIFIVGELFWAFVQFSSLFYQRQTIPKHELKSRS